MDWGSGDLDDIFLSRGLDVVWRVWSWAGMDCVLDCLLTIIFSLPDSLRNGHNENTKGQSCLQECVSFSSISTKTYDETSTLEANPKDAKAKAAKKAALQGAHGHKSRKTRFSVSFHRPKTLRLPREPRYPRKSIPHAPRMDQFRTIVSCVSYHSGETE